MNDDNDLSNTVIAKSDQLNADDLIEPITITITKVDKTKSNDQPVNIHSEGRQPYKPCLTMRRMLIAAWGKYKDKWVGQSMMVYCDPEVMWAGKAQGGIRVSHVTGINEPISKMLAITRGRKAVFTLLPMEAPEAKPVELTETDRQWIQAVKIDSEVLNQIEDPAYRSFIQSNLGE